MNVIRLLSIIAVLFCIVSPVYGASLTFTVPVSSLNGDQEMTVTASASGFSHDAIYIKGAFFRAGSSNYFGLTKSGDSWIKNSVSTGSQRHVILNEWNKQLTVRPDYDDSGFTGNGSYYFKIGYYTSPSDGVTWSETVATIDLQRPPTPTPTNTSSPTQTPGPTSTSTPVPTSKPTSTPTRTPTPRLSITPTDEVEEEEDEDILGEELTIAFVFVGLGAGILAILSLVSIINKRKKDQEYLVKS